MADDSNSNKEGSQWTRQSKSRSATKGAKGPGNNSKLQGDITELGNNVYVYGMRNQGDNYIKTMEAIAEYICREYNKAMRTLVKDKTETIPQEPEEPDGTDVSAY